MEVLVGQAVGTSLDQIDHVAAELDKMRDVLRSEGERVGCLVDNYVGLSNAAITAMKIISENLKALQRRE
jgi:hypothetical protein